MDQTREFTVRTIAHTGPRADEFAHLRSDWIDWQTERVRVPAEDRGWTPRTELVARTIPVRAPDTLRVMREVFKRDDAVDITRRAVYERVVRLADRTEARG